MSEAKTITVKQLAQALGCTERNVRMREGSSLPSSMPYRSPRCYVLADVLWWVDGKEREKLCRGLGLDLKNLKALHACGVVERGAGMGRKGGT